MLSKDGNKNYYITNTVTDKLDMLKVQKKKLVPSLEVQAIGLTGYREVYDWTVFNNISDRKATFIFPDNRLFRVQFYGNYMSFCYLTYTPETKIFGHTYWTMFYVRRDTGEQFDQDCRKDTMEIETMIYKLLCFIYLSENEEVIVPPGVKVGTKKKGFVNNELKDPLTVVTSKWNVTSVRTEGFTVDAHFALRWTGPGRTIPRMVLIEPFQKHGYVRRAKSETEG
jgi:hypothetical protein